MGEQSSLSPITKFWRLDGRDRWLLLRAVVALASARGQLARNSFQDLCVQLDESTVTSSDNSDEGIVPRISYAIGAAAKYVPWRSDCFPQCLAARSLLGLYGLESVIHLGVARVGEADLDGHAWLTCGDTVVTGGANLDRYTELRRFPGE